MPGCPSEEGQHLVPAELTPIRPPSLYLLTQGATGLASVKVLTKSEVKPQGQEHPFRVAVERVVDILTREPLDTEVHVTSTTGRRPAGESLPSVGRG